MLISLLVATGVLSLSGPVAAASAPSEAGDSRLCKALARIGALDARFDRVLADETWDEARKGLVQLGPKINRAWRAVVRRIPDEHEDDARLVAGFTKRVVKALADAESLNDAGEVLTSDPDALVAGLASQRLESFSQDTCNVSINNE